MAEGGGKAAPPQDQRHPKAQSRPVAQGAAPDLPQQGRPETKAARKARKTGAGAQAQKKEKAKGPTRDELGALPTINAQFGMFVADGPIRPLIEDVTGLLKSPEHNPHRGSLHMRELMTLLKSRPDKRYEFFFRRRRAADAFHGLLLASPNFRLFQWSRGPTSPPEWRLRLRHLDEAECARRDLQGIAARRERQHGWKAQCQAYLASRDGRAPFSRLYRTLCRKKVRIPSVLKFLRLLKKQFWVKLERAPHKDWTVVFRKLKRYQEQGLVLDRRRRPSAEEKAAAEEAREERRAVRRARAAFLDADAAIAERKASKAVERGQKSGGTRERAKAKALRKLEKAVQKKLQADPDAPPPQEEKKKRVRPVEGAEGQETAPKRPKQKHADAVPP